MGPIGPGAGVNDPQAVTLAPGEALTDLDFANVEDPQIHGRKWLDLNGDGRQDELEPGLPGWTIYLDLNFNGMLDVDPDSQEPLEPSTLTDENGDYWFTDLLPGTYVVAEVPGEVPWQQTYPNIANMNRHVLQLESGEIAAGIDFGNRRFGDCNNDGRVDREDIPAFNDAFHSEIGDPNFGQPGFGKYDPCFDYEMDGDVDFADLYQFRLALAAVLPAPLADSGDETGDELIDAVLKADADNASPQPADDPVPEAALSVPCETDFCIPPPGEAANGEIHGIKWLDLDGDGRIDDGEPPLPGVTIYLDLNNNGVRDTIALGGVVATEPYDITDANGAYDFFELPANDYVVREEIADALVQTFPTDHILVSTYNLHTIFQYDPATQRADMFAPVDVGRPLAGLSYSPGDDRVYGVTDDGRLYVIEELRGKSRLVGQLGFGDLAFFPVAVGEGDVAIDPNSIVLSNDDFTAAAYFVVGSGQPSADHIFTAQLNYAGCVDEPSDLLSCLPTLSSGRDLGALFANLGMHDLSGATVGDNGVLYVLGFQDPNVPVVAGFDLATGGLVGPFAISVMDDGLQFGGIDIDPATGLMHGVLSGSFADWHFTLNPADSVPTITVNQLPQRNQSDLQFIRTRAHRLFLGVDDVVGGDVVGGNAQIGANFGNLGESSGSIHGVKWEDVNGDGRIGRNEPLLPGWTIFIDLNNNGVLDDDEPSHVTDDDPETSTNETGRYWFTGLPAAEYTIAEVPQDGWMQSYPTHQVYLDFEDHDPGTRFVPGETFTTLGDDGQTMDVVVTPYIFSDGGQFSGYTEFDNQGISGGTGNDLQLNNVNLNFEFDPPLQGLSLLFSDLGGSVNLTVNGDFRFLQDLSEVDGQTVGGLLVSVQLVPGENRGVLQLSGQVESFAIGGQEFWVDRLCKNLGAGGSVALPPATHTVDLGFGQRVENVNFGNMRLGEIHGRKWHDINGNSEPDEDEYLAGWTIYLDLNENGRWDEGEEPATVTDERGGYWFTNLKNGTYTVGEVLQPGWEQTYPSPRPSSDLFQFEDVNPAAFYTFGDPFTVVADAGAIADVTVGSFVSSGGEVTTFGSVNAFGLGTVPANQALSISNATADFEFEEVLTGILLVYSDSGGNVNLNINGVLENVANLTALDGTLVGGTLVAVNQVSDNFGLLSITGEINSFAIGGQEFWIDNLLIAGQPVPGSGVHIIDVNGNIIRDADFGNRRLEGKIHGSKFNDFDGDGVRGPNDRGILGWEVYIDTNNNGQYDEGEPLETTNREGEYWFTNLEPGTYIVREIEVEGWTRTSPRATFNARQYEAGEQPVAVAEGDVDGDEIVDLVVADFGGERCADPVRLGRWDFRRSRLDRDRRATVRLDPG